MSDAWRGEGGALRFRGTPGSLQAAVPDPDMTARRLPVRLTLAPEGDAADAGWKARPTFAARAFRMDDDLVLQMALPPRTPPGTYEGTAEVDGEERPVVIEVEPEVELQLVPDQLTLRGAPGERVTVELTLVNAGNVAAEVRRAHAVGLFAVGGVERALHRTYMDGRQREKDGGDEAERAEGGRAAGERPVDRLFAHLGEEHGGLLRVAVEEGAGDVEPGERRALRVAFAIPDGVHPGRTYTGTWPLHDLRYYVRLVVGDGATMDPAAPR